MGHGLRDRFHELVDKEPVDPVPHELANPALAPPTLREQIQQSIRSELSLLAEDRGLESFDEADDFEEDEPEADPLTAYEMVMMTPESDETLDGPAEPAATEAETPPASDTSDPASGSPEPSEEAEKQADPPPAP